MRTTRVGALVAGSALTLGLLAPSSAATAADAEPKPLTDSVAWLQSQLGNNGLVPGFSGAGDYSLTADYALGLEEVGRDSELQTVAGSLVDQAAQAGDGTTSFKTARAAAAIWAHELVGEDASELLALLEASIADGGEQVDDDKDPETPDKTVADAAAGRALDKPFDSWTGTIGEAWAYTVLRDAASAKVGAVRDFLLAQQCPAGWFRYSWSAVDAPDQSCEGDPFSFADPDTTAYVAILLSDDTDAGVQAAVAEAIDWLLDQQSSDGSLAAGYDPTAYNANTTGLAARAFALNGEPGAASKAAAWVRRHQLTAIPGCAAATDTDSGAIAGTDGDLADAANGIVPEARGSWQFAAGQAFAALAHLPATNPVPAVSVPAGYQQGGTAVAVNVSGALAYDEVCLTAGSARFRIPAGGAATRSITLPAATGSVAVTATTASGAVGTTTVKVLGAKTIPVRVAKKVKRKKKLNVLVSGLAVGEKVSVRFRKQTVRGAASPAGTFIARLKVGKKLGKTKVIVTGEFANRKNTKIVRVVR
ncbi:MAG TPA: prenyltransferase/squalene oxidase repeat-containing protein [Nocardioides sp.]|uniref:prenyltransferase/squalene oxidase repeat-containing protein n=1 Tax=Nocardioides sp. TaxID=35761 RepID=UPI002EDAF652